MQPFGISAVAKHHIGVAGRFAEVTQSKLVVALLVHLSADVHLQNVYNFNEY